MSIGKEQLEEFLKNETEWKFKIVEYGSVKYEVPVTSKYMYISHDKKWNTSILYCTSIKPRWDNIKLCWKANAQAVSLEVRPFEHAIPFLASKESLIEIE